MVYIVLSVISLRHKCRTLQTRMNVSLPPSSPQRPKNPQYAPKRLDSRYFSPPMMQTRLLIYVIVDYLGPPMDSATNPKPTQITRTSHRIILESRYQNSHKKNTRILKNIKCTQILAQQFSRTLLRDAAAYGEISEERLDSQLHRHRRADARHG